MKFKELDAIHAKQLQVKIYEKVYHVNRMPEKHGNEIVIMGKSNVGKSTLINTILNHAITKTSKKPGCTRSLSYIKLTNSTIIDIPGYGYASVAKSRKTFWLGMIDDYFKSQRANLVLILVDARRGIQEIDASIANILPCESRFIFTKCDQKGCFIPPEYLGVSCKSGHGIHELRNIFCDL